MKVINNIYSWILILFLGPFWYFSKSPDKLTWVEFKSGLVKHKCEFDYDNPKFFSNEKISITKYYKCKRPGCNVGSMKEKDGSWCK